MDDYTAAARSRVIVYDGAGGTMLQAAGLGPDDFGGPDLEGCNELLNVTRPDVVAKLHASFLDVGVDVIETSTFGAFAIPLGEYGIAGRAYGLARAGAAIAKAVAGNYATADRPRWVAGSIGPGTKFASLGQISYVDLRDGYEIEAWGLLDGGVDLFLIETQYDLLGLKAAVNGSRRVYWQPPPRRSPPSPLRYCQSARGLLSSFERSTKEDSPSTLRQPRRSPTRESPRARSQGLSPDTTPSQQPATRRRPKLVSSDAPPDPEEPGTPSIPSSGSARKTDPGDYLFHGPQAYPSKRHCRHPSRGHPTWPPPTKERTPIDATQLESWAAHNAKHSPGVAVRAHSDVEVSLHHNAPPNPLSATRPTIPRRFPTTSMC